MAWQTPKTDWAPPDGVRDSDFNRIEGNILELYEADAARVNQTIYVSTTGNDTTGQGTSAQPYATISKALSKVPKNLNGKTIAISIAAGTYSEAVYVAGFSNGIVKFEGSGTVSVKGVQVTDGSILYISGITLSINLATSGVRVTNGSVFISTGDIIASNCSVGLMVTHCSSATVGNITIDKCTTGISAYNNASIYALSITGSQSGTGISATGGGIVSYGSFSATVNSAISATSSGGRIYTGSQSNTGGGGLI